MRRSPPHYSYGGIVWKPPSRSSLLFFCRFSSHIRITSECAEPLGKAVPPAIIFLPSPEPMPERCSLPLLVSSGTGPGSSFPFVTNGRCSDTRHFFPPPLFLLPFWPDAAGEHGASFSPRGDGSSAAFPRISLKAAKSPCSTAECRRPFFFRVFRGALGSPFSCKNGPNSLVFSFSLRVLSPFCVAARGSGADAAPGPSLFLSNPQAPSPLSRQKRLSLFFLGYAVAVEVGTADRATSEFCLPTQQRRKSSASFLPPFFSALSPGERPGQVD